MKTPTDDEQEEEEHAADDRADGLDAEPVGGAQVARVAREREALLGLLGEGRGRHAGHASGQTGGERAQGPFHERRLELELLEVLGLHRAQLREPGLHRIDRRAAGQAQDDQEDGTRREGGDEDGDRIHRLDLDVHDLADEHEADEHHETAEEEDDHPGRKAEDLGGFMNIGSMNLGAAMNRKPARPIGRNPTT